MSGARPFTRLLLSTGDQLDVAGALEEVEKPLQNAARSSPGTLARLTDAVSGEWVCVNPTHVVTLMPAPEESGGVLPRSSPPRRRRARVGGVKPRRKARMAHFKCLACKARVWRDGNPADHLRDLCPGCGGPLDPVARAEDIIGFRALRRRPHARRSIADEVREAIAHNDAARVRRLRSKEQPDRPT